jgi:hypothetical protein
MLLAKHITKVDYKFFQRENRMIQQQEREDNESRSTQRQC